MSNIGHYLRMTKAESFIKIHCSKKIRGTLYDIRGTLYDLRIKQSIKLLVSINHDQLISPVLVPMNVATMEKQQEDNPKMGMVLQVVATDQCSPLNPHD